MRKYFAGLLLALLGWPFLAAAETGMGEKPEGWVERAQFTHGIENREPVDDIVLLENNETEIYYFTDLRKLTGRTVTHRWEYEGRVMAEIPFKVGGPRWRVYSKKTLLPSQLGKWTVVVVDESGWPLHATVFRYVEAAVPAQPKDEGTAEAAEPSSAGEAQPEVPVAPPVEETPADDSRDGAMPAAPPAGETAPAPSPEPAPPASPEPETEVTAPGEEPPPAPEAILDPPAKDSAGSY